MLFRSQTIMEDTVERILEISEKNVEEKKKDILNSGNIDESKLDIDNTNIDLTELTKENLTLSTVVKHLIRRNSYVY